MAVCCSCVRAADDTLAMRVIVLANREEAGSVQLAMHYMERRGVPVPNLVVLPMPKGETISWRQFIDEIYQPMQDVLIKRGWIQAVKTTNTDKLGRKRYTISGHRISYLVVCRGVPLRIEHDPAFSEEARPFTDAEQFMTNCGAVDAELSLLACSGYAINAVVPNPLFMRETPSFLEEAQVVKVGRLGGPSYAAAAALVDNALKAEQQGLIGRAYVDIGGRYPEGDKWLESVVRQLDGFGYELEVDRLPSVFGATARFDEPALYFDWYAESLPGPFLRPGFRFPPGAIALHIHSFSVQTLHADNVGWCGPLVARGLTATFGNVYEPYLSFTHHPYLLVQALLVGNNLGDAAYYALPALSWQAVMIGDPLYRPFAVSFAEQWQRRHELSDEWFLYVVGRELKRLVKTGQSETAVKTAIEALQEHPSLLLALWSARLFKDTGDVQAARQAFDRVLPLRGVTPELVPVAAEAAQFCADHIDPAKAVEIYRTLLALETLPMEQRLQLLPPAMKAAEAGGQVETLEQWRQLQKGLSNRSGAERQP